MMFIYLYMVIIYLSICGVWNVLIVNILVSFVDVEGTK
jgi:hypothetical protein